MARTRRRAVGLAVAAALLVVGVSAAAPGDLDPSFDGDGIVVTSFAPGGGEDAAFALASYPGGKLVAAGWCRCDEGPGDFTFALARYNANGGLDASFGEDGRVTTSIRRLSESAYALAVLPDGRMVAAGSAGTRGGGTDFALARYHTDGTLDSTFGGDGTVTTAIGRYDQVDALVVQEDGKLVAAGGSGSTRRGAFALARYEADGTLDTSFGEDGIVTTPMGRGSAVRALVVQHDGKLVAAGVAGGPQRFALVRYHPDGSLDGSFGSGGIVRTEVGPDGSEAAALVLRQDGKLVAAGWAREEPRVSFALARYKPDGTLDTNFGGDGTVTTSIGRGDAAARALVLQEDGKLIAGGKGVTRRGSFDFTLARYRPNGSLDPGFGSDGIVFTTVGVTFNSLEALVLDDAGKIVAGGWANGPPTSNDFALARYSG